MEMFRASLEGTPGHHEGRIDVAAIAHIRARARQGRQGWMEPRVGAAATGTSTNRSELRVSLADRLPPYAVGTAEAPCHCGVL